MEDAREAARTLLRREGLTVIDLWILYWNRGGHCNPFDFDAFIHELLPAARFDADAFAGALDDLALETTS